MLITRILLVLEVWDDKPTYRKSWAGILLVWSDLTLEIMGWDSFGLVRFNLGPLVQGETRIAKLKSAYNGLIISPRGLQCETNL